MKSAIRCTLWMRFDDDTPISVVKESSFARIPSAFAFAVVRSGWRAPSSTCATCPPFAAAVSPCDELRGIDVAAGP